MAQIQENIQEIIRVKATANKWMSDNLNGERRYLMISTPEYDGSAWAVDLVTTTTKEVIGHLRIKEMKVCGHTRLDTIIRRMSAMMPSNQSPSPPDGKFTRWHELRFGDGADGAKQMEDGSIDLLLTDPPYGISSPYTCESQIPRRLRTNGADFIMPKGDFGRWDHEFSPESWTDVVLPKVGGWAVVFCSHAQIGQYSDILARHKFSAVGALAWHKTNPVPFNHKFKLLSAWEAAVVGKRPSTKFNGRSIHNVFTYKSPSPQHRIHPTQKPLGLMEELMGLFTDEGDRVFDPFAGSATTLLAAINLKRQCISYENDPACYARAVQRITESVG